MNAIDVVAWAVALMLFWPVVLVLAMVIEGVAAGFEWLVSRFKAWGKSRTMKPWPAKSNASTDYYPSKLRKAGAEFETFAEAAEVLDNIKIHETFEAALAASRSTRADLPTVELVEVRDGDRFVVSSPNAIDDELAEIWRKVIRENFPTTGEPLFLADGITLVVLRETEAAEAQIETPQPTGG